MALHCPESQGQSKEPEPLRAEGGRRGRPEWPVRPGKARGVTTEEERTQDKGAAQGSLLWTKAEKEGNGTRSASVKIKMENSTRQGSGYTWDCQALLTKHGVEPLRGRSLHSTEGKERTGAEPGQ